MNKFDVYQKVQQNQNKSDAVYAVSEYLYRIEKIIYYYKLTAEYYFQAKKIDNHNIDDEIQIIQNHISNKIRVDTGGNIFVKLPDGSKYYGDYEDYSAIVNNDEKLKQFCYEVIDEFNKVVNDDWEEDGKVFLYDNQGTTDDIIKKNQENHLIEKFKKLGLTSNYQEAIKLFNDHNINVENFDKVLSHIYKLKSAHVIITITDSIFTFKISDQDTTIIRSIENNTLKLIDFKRNMNPISFEDYSLIHNHETRYFKKQFLITKKIVNSEIQHLAPLLNLGYIFINKQKESELINKFISWMSVENGVDLDPEFYTTLNKCADLSYNDEEKNNVYNYFNDFLHQLLDPTQIIELSLNV